MRQPLVVGNWKMNGSLKQTSELLGSIDDNISDKMACEVGVCVPFVYLAAAVQAKTKLAIGAQTVSEYEAGAYTGEVSATMLADVGCQWVLVGHSERRVLFGEQDQPLLAKTLAAQKAGLVPIYCVGETEVQYKAGDTFKVIEQQVNSLLADSTVDLTRLVLAYEPVWAIGTGLTATPDEAQKVHAFIRQLVAASSVSLAAKLRILYGGSVKASNAASLFAQKDIDGGLIGGASLDAEAFISICQRA